jgi:hypothetical protein
VSSARGPLEGETPRLAADTPTRRRCDKPVTAA